MDAFDEFGVAILTRSSSSTLGRSIGEDVFAIEMGLDFFEKVLFESVGFDENRGYGFGSAVDLRCLGWSEFVAEFCERIEMDERNW
jgi:hypothetical protein